LAAAFVGSSGVSVAPPTDPLEWLLDDLAKAWTEFLGDADALCDAADTSCRVYDWRGKNGDTGNGGSPAIQDVLSCPVAADVTTHTFSDASTITFLNHAQEIIGVSGNNSNGLCESGETCLYTPNIGAYQGHSSLVAASSNVPNTAACADIGTGGTITNVTLMKYSINGVD